jgi:hypothetical protein
MVLAWLAVATMRSRGHPICLEGHVAPRFRFRRFDDSSYRWILLGGNDRLIGMAAEGSRTIREAIAAAHRVQAGVAEPVFTFNVGEDRRWYWRLEDSTGPIAVSVSGFDRRLDARRATKRFIRAAEGPPYNSASSWCPTGSGTGRGRRAIHGFRSG